MGTVDKTVGIEISIYQLVSIIPINEYVPINEQQHGQKVMTDKQTKETQHAYNGN